MKQIGLYINDRLNNSKKVQVKVCHEAYKIYKDLGKNKAGLIEALLVQVYEQNYFNIVFTSKRTNKSTEAISGDPVAIYNDAGSCKSVLIEKILIDIGSNEKYFMFLKSKRNGVTADGTIEEDFNDFLDMSIDNAGEDELGFDVDIEELSLN